MLSFPPFRLDVAEEQLWKETKLLAVRRKPFAILRYLVTNPRRLVTHDELLKEVWGGAVVSESSVRTHLHELRQVLGEGLIETVIGRGYRFTGEVVQDGHAAPAAPAPVVTDRLVVGREDELRVLQTALDRARTGHRQVVFVTGEPGIGKTTLVDAFLDSISDAFILRGACIEQHSTPEAYRPIIEMLGPLRYTKHAEQALALLVRHAPTFLAQVPQLVPDAQLEEVMRRGASGSESKITRELMEMFEAVSMHTVHVIVLEDLQWSDVATIDLLSLLGQRRERAKLLVIATSRRGEAQTVTHPLNRVMRALVARSGAIALPVDRLENVADYLAARFPGRTFSPQFVGTIENITGGTPLFLVALLDDLIARGMLDAPVEQIAAHRPDSVKQLIDIQLDRLTIQEQRMLEAASLVGPVFSTALAAAALDVPVETADELCDSLARRALFLQHEGTEDWPDGSQQSCYGFTHGLVREVCADRSAPARRQRWHRAIAQRLETAYGERAHEISTLLASHYEQAQVVGRAIELYIAAAEQMVKRFANGDALPHYQRALRLLERLPESRERDATELRILGGVSTTALRARVRNDESVAQMERMVALARKLGDTGALCTALMSLSVRYATLARYQDASAINVELVGLLTSQPHPGFGLAVLAARVVPLTWTGRLDEAIELLEQSDESDVFDDPQLGILDAVARKIVLMSYLGAAYWGKGKPDRSIGMFERASRIAVDRGDPFAFGLVRTNMANVMYFRRDDPQKIRAIAESVLANADAILMWQAQATLLLYWVQSTEAPLSAAVADDMIARFHERFTELPMAASYSSPKIIDALIRSGFHDRALAVADTMLEHAQRTGEHMFEPEVLRLRGNLIAGRDREGAIAAYRKALADAQAMNAHGLALRAAIDLVKLVPAEAPVLAATLAKIEGGEQLPDVLDAKQLLAR